MGDGGRKAFTLPQFEPDNAVTVEEEYLNTETKGFARRRLLLMYWLWGVVVLLVAGNAVAESGVPYTVALRGVTDEDLQKTLEAVSITVARKEEPPATLFLLRRRAADDVEALREVLRSQGYYAAEIRLEMNEETTPVSVVFEIQTGRRYLLKSVEIESIEGSSLPDVKMPSSSALGLAVGEPSDASRIVNAQDLLVRDVRRQGYPFARVADRRVIVDHSQEGVFVTYTLDAGPPGRFGDTTFKGLESVEEEFVRRKLPWRTGERFNADLFAEARKRYTDTRLFSLILIKEGEALDEEGRLPITVELTERKHRSIRAGVSYKTDEGAGVAASWENRNLFHEGERFKTALTLSELVIALDNTFQKVDFFRPDQVLNANLRVARENTDAFTSNNVESSLIVQRDLRPGMKVGLGPGLRLSEVDPKAPDSDRETFALVSLPGQFDWDFSDNLLDPTRGGRLRLQAAPYYDLLGSDVSFFKSYGSYSHYLTLLEHPFLVFAGRAAVGSMSGVDTNSIPADIRFYAGGGGSIRGYAYQSVSPLLDGDPVGGRSLLEFSAEFRLKITQTIGLVAFLDGGSAFDSVYPDFDTSLRWGTGGGVRYFTPIGPLRVDVGVPLDRREGLDDAFQVYISLGQAF
ncbi:outer membrane protein assembly factor [Desulforhabdus sp. TSK]|nr:outer membrane protein assembly factor [Desulforhabdus sp. TSK]